MAYFSCRVCGERYLIGSNRYICQCGGHFQLDVSQIVSHEGSSRSIWGLAPILSTLISVADSQISDGSANYGGDSSMDILSSVDHLSKEAISTFLERNVISLGEGWTPQIRDLLLSQGDDRVDLKLDFLNPTLSYKDRGSALLVSAAKASGIQSAAVDSSGNAAVSLAAYCSRAGIELSVYLPEGTSKSKIAQIKRFGGVVNEVPGDRSATSVAILEELEKGDTYYMSHIYNPLFHHGTKSLLYELIEGNGGQVPDEVVIPAGNGTLLLGIGIAISELKRLDNDFKVPRVVVVQAANVAPIYSLLANGDRALRDDQQQFEEAYRVVAPGIILKSLVGNARATDSPSPSATMSTATSKLYGERKMATTLAEGIAIATPPRLSEMVELISNYGWPVVAVEEDEIVSAKTMLSVQGVDVEDTAAATYAGAKKWLEFRRAKSLDPIDGSGCNENPDKSPLCVVELTGAGLKSPYRT
ncbi:MAG: pyridoxal-phosphate dependent enzyme [Actinomycetota bacterium]|nr:pyridoxal-phosphate dependent enzyme [Actinomycetota bacterium]